MANVAVIGTQWGDEGKGKIVDWLSERADIVVRFQGGHNAGHTLVIDRKEYKLSILPSGIVRTGKLSIIGNGTVVDPFHLLSEIKYLRDQGINISSRNLLLSETATLILPIHAKVDKARELLRGSSKIGTTGRGIGPAYEDKIARRALRIGDLSDNSILEEKIEQIVSWHNIFLKEVGEDEVYVHTIIEQLMPIIPEILSFSGRSWEALAHAHINGKRILFEGAQGVMLDIDHGTYPFVTSSNTVAALCGLFAFLGHCYPVYFDFRGGKGVATAFGVVAMLHWPSCAAIALLWVGTFALTRVASLASLLSWSLAPFAIYVWAEQYLNPVLILIAILIYRHYPNLFLLVKGNENRFGELAKNSQSTDNNQAK